MYNCLYKSFNDLFLCRRYKNITKMVQLISRCKDIMDQSASQPVSQSVCLFLTNRPTSASQSVCLSIFDRQTDFYK